MHMESLGPNTLVKALKADRTHNFYTYTEGRNDCPEPFSERECYKGGLYGCRLKDLLNWALLYETIDTVAIVEIPEDARVIWFDTKFKASSLVLTPHVMPLLTAIELAIRHGADINSKNDLLCLASANGRIDIITLLLDNHADIHVSDDAPIRNASVAGHFEVVEYLLGKGANAHAENDRVFRSAAKYGHLKLVKYLAGLGANIRAKNDDALRWASINGHIDVVKYLVEKKANIHAEDEEALRWAAKYGHLDVVKYLVGLGADIHAHKNEALRWASEEHLDVVKYLLSKGANVHALENDALCLAARRGKLDIVHLLVQNKADIHAMNDEPIRWASEEGHLDVVEYLLACGAKVDQAMIRFARKHDKVVQLLTTYHNANNMCCGCGF